jgi:hypothetical protein
MFRLPLRLDSSDILQKKKKRNYKVNHNFRHFPFNPSLLDQNVDLISLALKAVNLCHMTMK